MPGSSERDRDRLALGSGAVLTVARAAELLPIHDAEARQWIRTQGLVRFLVSREVVIWGDVTDALREGQAHPTPAPPKHRPARLKL
jgi:hypothetical protein